ncbi:hypothetical protein LKM13_24100 [Bacillus anthracis]|uniref:hypothetical protein n=1 Tax=Bacillus anthracis TaxID=1392 RepID=UPI001D0F175A|nr:hypothetical protein [Bacillus anthracis]MCC2347126.1 hypothetical protein [Bacillus anthracis]
MLSFLVLTDKLSKKKLELAESFFDFKFHNDTQKSVSAFSHDYKISLTCRKNSLQFLLLESKFSNIVTEYLNTEFKNEISGVYIDDEDIGKYNFLKDVVEEKLLILN